MLIELEEFKIFAKTITGDEFLKRIKGINICPEDFGLIEAIPCTSDCMKCYHETIKDIKFKGECETIEEVVDDIKTKVEENKKDTILIDLLIKENNKLKKEIEDLNSTIENKDGCINIFREECETLQYNCNKYIKENQIQEKQIKDMREDIKRIIRVNDILDEISKSKEQEVSK